MYLYIVASGNGLFKIGKTEKVDGRFFSIKSASPIDCQILFVAEYDEDKLDLEKHYHKLFADKRKSGEWFNLSKSDVLEIVGSNYDVVLLLDFMEENYFFDIYEKNPLPNGILASLYRMESVRYKNKW